MRDLSPISDSDIEQASNGSQAGVVVDVLAPKLPADPSKPLHRLEEEGGFCFSTFLSLFFLVGNVALGIYLAVYSYLYPGPPLTYAPTLEPALTAAPSSEASTVTRDAATFKSASSSSILMWRDIGIILEGKDSGDYLGLSVAISTDASTIAAGGAGFVSVYGFLPDGQLQEKGHILLGEDSLDKFGGSVSLSQDGDLLAVGASGYANVYYYEDGDNSTLAQWTQLGDSIPMIGDGLVPVSLSGAGDMLALGDPYNNTVQVMRYSSFSSYWTRVGGALTGIQLRPTVYESFGHCVSFSNDGRFLAIGGPEYNSANIYHLSNGEFILFERLLLGASTRRLVTQGLAPGAHLPQMYGASMALTSDGNCVIAGAPGVPGYAKVSCNSHDALTWYIVGKPIVAPASDIQFGVSVALSMDVAADPSTWTAMVGASASNETAPFGGAVYIYQFLNDDWSLVDTLAGHAGYGLGNSISISHDAGVLVAGASSSSENGAQSGQVRVFRQFTCPVGYSHADQCFPSITA